MATSSSILAWKILWTEEPSNLRSMRSQRVGHDRSFMYRDRKVDQILCLLPLHSIMKLLPVMYHTFLYLEMPQTLYISHVNMRGFYLAFRVQDAVKEKKNCNFLVTIVTV